jgi:hypothetical protein
MAQPRVGDRVRIERDEKLWPPRGSWKQYRGREGIVVQVNRTDKEWGVVFGATRSRPDGSLHGSDQVSWFKLHELRVLEPAQA